MFDFYFLMGLPKEYHENPEIMLEKHPVAKETKLESCTVQRIDFDDWLSVYVETSEKDGKEYVSNVSAIYEVGGWHPIKSMHPVPREECRFKDDIMQVELEALGHPLNLKVSPNFCPKVKEGVEYECNIVGFVYDLVVFEHMGEFFDYFSFLKGGGVSIKELLPIGITAREEKEAFPYSYGKDSAILFNGIIRKAERRVCTLTGLSYRFLTVESKGITLDFLSPDNASPIPKEGQIVSGYSYLCGSIRPHSGNFKGITFNNSESERQWQEEISPAIIAMREMQNECLTISFEEEDVLCDTRFIQTAYCDDGYVVEIGVFKDGVNYIYRHESSDMMFTLRAFYDLCVSRKAPDLSIYKDVSREVFGNVCDENDTATDK